MSNYSCYTIGHSNHTVAHFLQLLDTHDIACVVDVRSAPYSKYVTQFNKEPLQLSLQEAGRQYVYMGKVLGGRWTDPKLCFENGIIDYGKVGHTKEFRQGLAMLIKNVRKGLRVALMCCEKDPYDCHRFVLISRFLKEEGVRIQHITAESALVDNSFLERRLLGQYSPQEDLFTKELAEDVALNRAYVQHNRSIAYKVPEITPP